MLYFYPTLNTYTYNVSMNIYHYRLYISIQIYMFQNGQRSLHTLLWWHDIQAMCLLVIIIAWNGTILYEQY